MKITNSNRGMTLVELMVVVSIVGIMLTLSTIGFNSWQVKYNVEAQTRALYADLNEARNNAYTRKRAIGIVFQPKSYVMKSYSSPVEYATDADANANGVVLTTKDLKYGITMSGSNITNKSVVYDTSGLTNNWFTVFVTSTSSSAALNCIAISTARVNMGKINGTTCEFK